ncbi:uncharacterized protein LOC127751737 [Frankliniella occidentalis]|uniref:Uncharacterized protein LOC127751737 n=1 Tax=Frankliniella occidentalis TaxID=133901 RepID=A0A9C6XV31_FRAOC|nr:uncharacterized protein LOC127751737 [Frankliniella occidentalis]
MEPEPMREHPGGQHGGTLWSRRDGRWKCVRLLGTLPRLPQQTIGEGFQVVKRWAREKGVYDHLYPLFAYYYTQWLVRVTPRRLTTYGRYHTSTNVVETHHHHLNVLANVDQVNAWDLCAPLARPPLPVPRPPAPLLRPQLPVPRPPRAAPQLPAPQLPAPQLPAPQLPAPRPAAPVPAFQGHRGRFLGRGRGRFVDDRPNLEHPLAAQPPSPPRVQMVGQLRGPVVAGQPHGINPGHGRGRGRGAQHGPEQEPLPPGRPPTGPPPPPPPPAAQAAPAVGEQPEPGDLNLAVVAMSISSSSGTEYSADMDVDTDPVRRPLVLEVGRD